MTPEAQRIAIAEAHKGGKFYFENGTFYRWHTESCPQPFDRPCREGGWLVRVELPNYLTDLNAMHEAVMSQPKDFLMGFAKNLCDVTGWGLNLNGCVTYIIHATAAQRAEAFLRTLNRWTA